MAKKVKYKSIEIPSGKTMKIWKHIIDNPNTNLASCKKATKLQMTSSTFYTIRKKITNKGNGKQTTKKVGRNYSGVVTIISLIRKALDKNPEITYEEFIKNTNTKTTFTYFSTAKSRYLNKGSSNTSYSKFRKGTAEIIDTISLDDFIGQEDSMMNVLTETFIPSINRSLGQRLEAVRLHTPNAIEIRKYVK